MLQFMSKEESTSVKVEKTVKLQSNRFCRNFQSTIFQQFNTSRKNSWHWWGCIGDAHTHCIQNSGHHKASCGVIMLHSWIKSRFEIPTQQNVWARLCCKWLRGLNPPLFKVPLLFSRTKCSGALTELYFVSYILFQFCSIHSKTSALALIFNLTTFVYFFIKTS